MVSTLVHQLRQYKSARFFTGFTRLLLAVGFFIPGLKKVLGIPFTLLPTSDPVGYFFDAFFQAHEFYVAVGLAQVVAAILLVVPRTATLGAVLYFPVILNITIITWSIDFTGTKWITLFMCLACTFLLVWDYDRLKGLLPIKERRIQPARILWRTPIFLFAALGILGYASMAIINLANVWVHFGGLGFVGAAVCGALGGGLVALHVRFMP